MLTSCYLVIYSSDNIEYLSIKLPSFTINFDYLDLERFDLIAAFLVVYFCVSDALKVKQNLHVTVGIS